MSRALLSFKRLICLAARLCSKVNSKPALSLGVDSAEMLSEGLTDVSSVGAYIKAYHLESERDETPSFSRNVGQMRLEEA